MGDDFDHLIGGLGEVSFVDFAFFGGFLVVLPEEVFAFFVVELRGSKVHTKEDILAWDIASGFDGFDEEFKWLFVVGF